MPHFVGTPVTVAGTVYGAAAGDFATVTSDLTAPLAATTGTGAEGLDTACAPISRSLAGTIAVVSRGDCAFTVKITNAQQAGAVAVLVVNNIAGLPTPMGTDGTATQPTIPAYMLPLSAGSAVKAASGQSATIGRSSATPRAPTTAT